MPVQTTNFVILFEDNTFCVTIFKKSKGSYFPIVDWTWMNFIYNVVCHVTRLNIKSQYASTSQVFFVKKSKIKLQKGGAWGQIEIL